MSASVFVFFFREHHRIHKHPDVARCPRKFKKPGSIIAVKTNAGFTRPANEGLSMSTLDFFFFCHCFSFLALCFHKEKKKSFYLFRLWNENRLIFPFSLSLVFMLCALLPVNPCWVFFFFRCEASFRVRNWKDFLASNKDYTFP